MHLNINYRLKQFKDIKSENIIDFYNFYCYNSANNKKILLQVSKYYKQFILYLDICWYYNIFNCNYVLFLTHINPQVLLVRRTNFFTEKGGTPYAGIRGINQLQRCGEHLFF